ncbi:PspA-associated protein PspAB [Halarchaeum sp. P4]|uniref:PspA-associated protein PspAB n=1 Tax=Halarchaeum sp. P4 TaxID=3421639 RepID=UPI003EBE2607
MGFFDTVRDVLGLSAERDATREADPEDFFQLNSASVTMEADLDYEPAPQAGLCLSAVSSTDFKSTLRDVEDVLEGDGFSEIRTDEHGYTWAVVERDDITDLTTELYVAADTLVERGYGNRLLAAVFGFDPLDGGRTVYWVYSFKRGSFYPFAPADDHERDSSTEFTLQSVLDGELDVEDDRSYWYPLWPDTPGGHPWE